MDIVIVMNTPVFQSICTNNMTHYTDGCIVMVAPVFQSNCTNNMTHYSDGCVYSDGYTRISEELYKQHDTQ